VSATVDPAPGKTPSQARRRKPGLVGWVVNRVGLDDTMEDQYNRVVPKHATNYIYCFGGVAFVLFLILAITGILLAVYYQPTPDTAYQSVINISTHVQFGWWVRSIHHWAAGGMVLLVFVHMLRVFFTGAYKAPRELNWLTGVALFGITMGFGFTGYLLPWDQKAYWATKVGTDIAGSVPFIGHFLLVSLRGGEQIELVEFGAQEFLVGQEGFVLGDHGRGERAAEAILDDLAVLGGAEQQADGRALVGFAHIAVEGFEVEIEFAEVLGLKAPGFEFKCDQAIEAAMEEQQVQREILAADLDGIFGADKTEVAAHFDDEILEVPEQAPMQIRLRMIRRQIQELEDVGVAKELQNSGMRLCQHCWHIWWVQHHAGKQRSIELPLKLPTGPSFTKGHTNVKLPFLRDF